MMDTQERLQALQAEADRQHSRFENRRQTRTARSKSLNAAIALIAIATGAASVAQVPTAAAIILATALLIAVGTNLALTDTAHDRELHLLSNAWRRHRTDATRLLAQLATGRSANTAERIGKATVELECRIAETRAGGY